MSSSASRTDLYLEPSLADRRGGSLIASRRVSWAMLILSLILSDALAMGAAFRVAYWIRFELALPFFFLETPPSFQFYSQLVMVMVPVLLLTYAVTGLYQKENLLGGTREYALVFRSTTVGLLLIVVGEFLDPDLVVARGWMLLAWGLAFILVSVGRFTIRRAVYALRKRGYFLTPALLIGANEEGNLLVQQLQTWETSGLQLVGMIDESPGRDDRNDAQTKPLGSLEQLDEIIQNYGIGEIILATSALSREQMLDIFRRHGISDQVNMRMSSGLFEIISTGLQVKEIGYVPLVSVNKVRLAGPDRALKFLLDLSLSTLALIPAIPSLLLLALAIKLDSPGPVIHRRRVMGLNGKRFDAYKLRTMYVNGDEMLRDRPDLQQELTENHKLVEDPRVTRVGKIIRRFSLDELPQLFNVLKGEMSWVGPRMISPEEMDKYDQWGINLLTVRPGITGLWQVSGRSEIAYADRVRLDMHYIRNWTIWLDLHLLLQTIPAVLKARGAY